MTIDGHCSEVAKSLLYFNASVRLELRVLVVQVFKLQHFSIGRTHHPIGEQPNVSSLVSRH